MPEITKTREQLIERAATELGVLTSGEALSDEDSDTFDNLVDPLVRSLSLDNVVTIGDVEESIEAEFFLPLARLLANEAAPAFGQQYSRDVKLENERQLRRLSAARPTGEALKAVYY